MAYYRPQQNQPLGATFVPGALDDDYYMPVASPPLVAPEPQRINPEMSNQISDGLHHLDLNSRRASNNMPHLSPFPKLNNPPPNVPPSDDDLESRLESARELVLNNPDPEVQLAWAQDALTYVGVCYDEAERLAALKPHQPRAATPRIEHQLKQDAMNIVTFLADQHHPRAEFMRGMWLEWGRFGQREDKKEAFRCYSRAADRGYARAQYRIGMLYESYNDPIKALRHYHRGVDAGDAASCYRLGMMTLRGQHGQPQDFAKGIDLIKRSAVSADENAAQGAYVYGMLLSRQLPQIDVPETYLDFNEGAAKMNIEKAAYMKFAKAQAKMGSCYELGAMGCEFNPLLSMHYNALASKQGEADADMALSKWFLVGSEGQFPKNEELAYTYAERAAASGLPTAEFALGYFHEIGMHVRVDLGKAEEWYNKAAKHGNDDAKGRLEGLARKQVLSKTDHENVAINKIKSQHGSMRGQRPDRFRQKPQVPQIPTVQEVPYSPSVYSPVASDWGADQQPARASSRTPYPEDNGPPKIDPLPRPASAVPYPLEDGPLNGSGPSGGYYNASHAPRPATTLNQDPRPSSAFQVNPELRSNSAVPAQARPYPAGGPQGQGLRPYTAQPYDQRQSSAPGYGFDGRPLNPRDPRSRPGMGDRIASGPAGLQNARPSQGAPPPPGPGYLPHNPTAPAAPMGRGGPGPAPGGRPDLGFSAPVEQRPPLVDPTYQERPPRHGRLTDGRESTMPNFDQPPNPRPGSRPPPDNRRPTPSGSPALGTGPKPPPKTAAPAAASAPAKPPPGKGPKTFDEMGVPAQDREKECVIM